MVGSVLLDRMRQENDFGGYEPVFFSTSQAGQQGPEINGEVHTLKDAFDTQTLQHMDAIVTCQGSGYTKKMYPQLRGNGWNGYWIDASSALRMDDEAVIVLDPINRSLIDTALDKGVTAFAGGNCTVSLMLMAIGGLFRHEMVSWVSSMTYQAASGAGAKNMKELVAQFRSLGNTAAPLLDDPAAGALAIDERIDAHLKGGDLPCDQFGAPLAGSLLPWIDSAMENGQTREEWKGMAETNKILATGTPVPVDGICVRIGTMRCHSQALTIKLRKEASVNELAQMMESAHQWSKIVPNTKEDTIAQLTPAAVAGDINVYTGRIRKMHMGDDYVSMFTVGDQLLWGAAEPVRRILKIVLQRLGV